MFAFDGCTEGSDLSTHKNNANLFKTWPVDGPTGLHAGATYFQKDELSYGIVKNTGSLNTKYSITFLVHIYPETDGTLIYFGDENRGLRLTLSAGELTFMIFDTVNNLTSELKVSGSIKDMNKWHYVAAIYDFNVPEIRLSIDGKVEKTPSQDRILPTDTENVYFGINSQLLESYAGRISCVQIYDRALPGDEITEKEDCPSGVGSEVEGKSSLRLFNSKCAFDHLTLLMIYFCDFANIYYLE